jgi:hypothetical protein
VCGRGRAEEQVCEEAAEWSLCLLGYLGTFLFSVNTIT